MKKNSVKEIELAQNLGKSPNPETERELELLRNEIDEQDRELIHILSKRHELVRRATECKISLGRDLWAENRVQKIISTRSEWARRENIDPTLVADIFRQLIDSNMQFEYEMLHKRRKK